MRKLTAIGCCLAHLAFVLTIGAAHIHDAGDHHEEMRGVHRDHTHFDHVHFADAGEAHQPHPHEHEYEPPAAQVDLGFESRHVGHHHCDAVYLSATAHRGAGSKSLGAADAVFAGYTQHTPPLVAGSRVEPVDQRRGPPGRRSAPPRAPPA